MLIAAALGDLGHLEQAEDHWAEAERWFRQAIARQSAASGPGDPTVGVWLASVSGMLREQGQHTESLRAARQSLTILQARLEPTDSRFVMALTELDANKQPRYRIERELGRGGMGAV